ncbi:MAG TPA: glycosyltransferase 87 family protein [Nocardioides sp.]|nr:glycosyltransferase 87 family protein [Nocardioides sp.]
MTREDWCRLARTSGFMALWVLSVFFAVTVVHSFVDRHWMGGDAHAYWLAGRSATPYQLAAPGHLDAFEYSPVFLQLVRPFAHLPFTAFAVGWSLVELVIFWWMTNGLAWRWRVPVLLLCVPELALGNINAFLGLVVVFGFARPELWAFPALTKITPTAIGVVWFLVRGEWSAVVRLAVTVVVVSGASYLVEPSLWSAWFHYLTSHSSDTLPRGAWHLADQRLDVGLRLLVACAATAYLARRDLRWPLPMALIVAVPVFGYSAGQILAMIPPMIRMARHDRRTAERPEAVAAD